MDKKNFKSVLPPSDLSPSSSKSQDVDYPLLTPNSPLEETPTLSIDLARNNDILNDLNCDEGLKVFISIVNSNNNKVISDEPSSRDPMVESSSSEESCSVIKEPVCTQLLTQLNTAYQHLAPDAQAIFYNQENGGKPSLPGIQLVVPKPPKNYEFMQWNWPRIRQISFWLMVVLMFTFTSFAIRGIITMPKRCNPPVEWWQGKVFYEIFPASFQDSSKLGDGIGDLEGISMRINYLKSLGVKGIRLNSIFSSAHYPEYYNDVNSLTKIDENLGTITDFENLLATLHHHDINLILDLPLYPFVRGFQSNADQNPNESNLNPIAKREILLKNSSNVLQFPDDKNVSKIERLVSNFIDPSQAEDEVTLALKFWMKKRVDGFFLKGLENYVNQVGFVSLLNSWKRTLGDQRVLMCDVEVLKAANSLETKRKIVETVDLINVRLRFTNGTRNLKVQIDDVLKWNLFSKETHAWVHWSVSSLETNRVVSTMASKNASAAVTMMTMMLPGTSNIFYGDEIGMSECACEDHKDLSHTHNVPPMLWEIIYGKMGTKFTSENVSPWLPKSPTPIPTTLDDSLPEMIKWRQSTPSIFVQSAFKHDHENINCDIRYLQHELIIVERWYPRQFTYVFVANFGNSSQTKDLSSLYYQGFIVIGPKHKLNQIIYFKQLIIAPGEAFIIKLDK